MTKKRVTVTVHGADGNLWHSGSYEITVTDLFEGKRLAFEESSNPAVQLNLEVPFDAGQRYGVTLDAKKHRPAFMLVRRQDFIQERDDIEGDAARASLMLVPDKPVSGDLHAGHDELQAIGSPLVAPGVGVKPLQYAALPAAAKMAFLNIEAKLRATFVEGTSLLSFVAGVRHVAVDRLFLFMDPRAKEAVRRSRDFADAKGHGAPEDFPGTPAHPDSFKHTRFGEGNVQLSFSDRTETFVEGGGVPCHSVDVDIDLASGLDHVGEFLLNNVIKPGTKTEQTIVYALLFKQDIRPKYTFDVLPAAGGARRRSAARGRSTRTRTPARANPSR